LIITFLIEGRLLTVRRSSSTSYVLIEQVSVLVLCLPCKTDISNKSRNRHDRRIALFDRSNSKPNS